MWLVGVGGGRVALTLASMLGGHVQIFLMKSLKHVLARFARSGH